MDLLLASLSACLTLTYHMLFCRYQGSRTNIGGIKETKEVLSNFQDGSSSRNTDSTSPTSTLTSLCEDADSGIFLASDFISFEISLSVYIDLNKKTIIFFYIFLNMVEIMNARSDFYELYQFL